MAEKWESTQFLVWLVHKLGLMWLVHNLWLVSLVVWLVHCRRNFHWKERKSEERRYLDSVDKTTSQSIADTSPTRSTSIYNPTHHMLSRAFSTSTAAAAAAPLRAGIILSRTPIVTPDTPDFDRLFYEYQHSLERRLMWTFPKWYYFKRGTVAERDFSEAQKYPIPYHRGVWFPQGNPDLKHGRDRRFPQEVILPSSANTEGAEDLDDIGRPIKANPRRTPADDANDTTSLERCLPRTLYLVVQNSSTGSWTFPSFPAIEEDFNKGLHQISEDGLRSLGGDKINSWSVSNSPAAVIPHHDDPNIKEFLFKSHIVAGKFVPQKDAPIKAYNWLNKDELAKTLDKAYYARVNHLLSDI